MSVGRLVAIVLASIASLILVRKLPISDYAAYQMLTKRIYTYLMFPVTIASYWAYRYLAQGVKGSFKTFMVFAVASSLASFVLGAVQVYFMGFNIVTSIILGMCVSLIVLYNGVLGVLTGTYPRMVSYSGVTRNLVYVGSIVVATYTFGLHLALVGTACVVSLLVGIAMLMFSSASLLKEKLCRQCIREWIRGGWLPMLGWFAGFVANLDVLVVSTLASERVVAAFFALTLVPRMVVETIVWGFGHLQAFVLKTYDIRSAVDASRPLTALVAFTVGYTIALPEQMAAFSGAKYLYAAIALPFLVIPLLLYVLNDAVMKLVAGLDASRASRPGMLLIDNVKSALYGAIVYIALLAMLVRVFHGVDDVILLACWGVALLVLQLTTMVYRLARLNIATRNIVLRRLILPAMAYTVVAYTASVLLGHNIYSTTFVENLMFAISSMLKPLAVYTIIIVVVDSVARRLVHRLLRILHVACQTSKNNR